MQESVPVIEKNLARGGGGEHGKGGRWVTGAADVGIVHCVGRCAQATLVLSGSSDAVETSTVGFGVGNAPGVGLRSSPGLRTGTRVEEGFRSIVYCSGV